MSGFARRALVVVLITYLALAGYILGRFANDAMPTNYLALLETEWYRTFLAARTPGYPALFADDPKPTALLRTLIPVYVTGSEAQ